MMHAKGQELKIKIGEREELDKEMDKFLENPSLISKEPEDVVFLTPSQFSSIFTKNRVETLKVIEDIKPKTMKDLVQTLKRPKESVSRDVGVLSKAGIIRIHQHGIYRTPEVINRTMSVTF